MAEETPESPAFGDVSAAVETAVLPGTHETHFIPAPASFAAFRDAARSLKAAEDALVAARQVYAEAVKALSEEAVR